MYLAVLGLSWVMWDPSLQWLDSSCDAQDPEHMDSVVVVHELSSPEAGGILVP